MLCSIVLELSVLLPSSCASVLLSLHTDLLEVDSKAFQRETVSFPCLGLQIMGMLSHGPDFRPEVPENLDSLPGGTFDGIHHYIQLMRDCWTEVSFLSMLTYSLLLSVLQFAHPIPTDALPGHVHSPYVHL